MAAVITPDIPPFASESMSEMTPDEALGALSHSVGYFGSYAVDQATATASHRIEGSVFPNWAGKTHPRFFRLDGDDLVITTPPRPAPGGNVVHTLRWRRPT